MKITDITVEVSEGKTKVSGLVGNEKLWFIVDQELSEVRVGDVFICAAISSAMRDKSDIYLDEKWGVSEKLLLALDEYQRIFEYWYPEIFCKVNIYARTEVPLKGEDTVGSFFSGGADSLYSFLRNEAEVDNLVFIHGLDMQLDNRSQFETVYKANKAFSDSRDKKLILVETNMRYLPTSRGLSWPLHAQGMGLACVAHLLGYKKMYIPASYTYTELFPCASHPLTDPMLSSEAVTINHDGAERRSLKIKQIAKDIKALDMLRVCWHDDGYNCGRCEKCVRTMLTLRLLNLKSASFPELTDLNILNSFRLHDKSEYTFVQDSLALAISENRNEEAKFLRNLNRKLVLKKALIQLEAALFGGKLKKLLQRK